MQGCWRVSSILVELEDYAGRDYWGEIEHTLSLMEKGEGSVDKWYWPHKTRDSWKHQLLLLLFARAYPNPLSIIEIKSYMEAHGVIMRDIRKVLYEYYHYYQIVERMSRGVYVLSDWYYKALNTLKPYWRIMLYCMEDKIKKGDFDSINNCSIEIQSIISKILINKRAYSKSEKVRKSPKKQQEMFYFRTFR